MMITIIARPTVDPQRVDVIKLAMLELVEKTRLEPGCMLYELHQDRTEPNRFVFVENWSDRDLWTQHMNGDAIKTFNAKIAGGIIAFDLQELVKIA